MKGTDGEVNVDIIEIIISFVAPLSKQQAPNMISFGI